MKLKSLKYLAFVAVTLIGSNLLFQEPVACVWAANQSNLSSPATALDHQHFPIVLCCVVAFVLASFILSLFLYHKYYKKYWDKIDTREKRSKELKTSESKQQVSAENG